MRIEQKRLLFLLAVMGGLTGCLKPFHYVKPEVQLNPQWTQQDATAVTSRESDAAWWHAFGDPTLDRLIETARRQNLPLQTAGLRIYEARAELALSVGRQYPQLQAAFASATAVGLSEHAANSAFADRQYGDYQLGFDAEWEIDFWGRYKGEVRAATAQHLATLADYDASLISLTGEVARTYAVIRTFETLIAQSQANVILQEEGQRIASARFKYGATSELDVHQATTLLESTKATIPQLEISLAQAKNALATLLGQPPGTVDGMLTTAAGIPAAPAEVAVSMPAELLRRRPDIRRQELLSIAQGERIGVARADLYPRFTLFGEIGLQTSSGAGTLSNDAKVSDLFKGGSIFWAFGPRISWPIWNYGRIKNNIRIQDARFQEQLVDYQNTVLEAQREVEDGLVGYLKSKEATVFSQNAAEAAQRSADLAMVQYREGAVDYQRVLDAQRSLLQEQISLTENRSSIATNLIALYKALGGSWELHEVPIVPDGIREEMEQRTDWGDLLAEPSPETTTPASSGDR
jgi:NodT family efflux transporter outer membrane factor (OMF) lipoprotein